MSSLDPKNSDKLEISVIMPALNEEENIIPAINDVLRALTAFGINGEVIVINDGSSDLTERLVRSKMQDTLNLRILKHEFPQGIGASFRDGVNNAKGDALVLLPGDNENDAAEVIRYCLLLKYVDIVVPFVINREVRSGSRRLFSKIFLLIINICFGTYFNYTNGNIIYKKAVFKTFKQESDGFFFQTECLIKATRAGFTFAEVPINIRGRKKGLSKAMSWKSFCTVAGEFIRLFMQVYVFNNIKTKK